MKTVFIIILNFNGEKDTIECLDSINQLLTTSYQLRTIVVDNGSKDKLAVSSNPSTLLRASELVVIRNNENLGFAGGNNVGISYALKNGADYIMILNNDTVVDKNLVAELLKAMDKDKTIGIVVPKIYFAKGFEFHKDRYKKEDLGKVIWYAGGEMDWKNVLGHHRGVDEVDGGQYDSVEETDFASGCCMMVKKEVFEKIGMFDPKYFLYYEDSDLSQKAKAAGFKIVFAPKAILWHKNAGSAGGSGSTLQDYYITRNRLFFGLRYASLRSKLALLRESMGLLIKGRLWQRRGVLDFYLARFGRGSYLI